MKRVAYSLLVAATMLSAVSVADAAAPKTAVATIKAALPIGYTLGFRDGKQYAANNGQSEQLMDQAYNDAYNNWAYYSSIGENDQAEFWHGYVDGLNWIPDSGTPVIP